jgi:hypothetical protein
MSNPARAQTSAHAKFEGDFSRSCQASRQASVCSHASLSAIVSGVWSSSVCLSIKFHQWEAVYSRHPSRVNLSMACSRASKGSPRASAGSSLSSLHSGQELSGSGQFRLPHREQANFMRPPFQDLESFASFPARLRRPIACTRRAGIWIIEPP